MAVCAIDGCERGGQMRRGMCPKHYKQASQRGFDPLPSPAERLAAGLKRMPNGCLEWTRTTASGYGYMSVDNKMVGTHRLAWALAHGPIPPGLSVLHHCDVRPCCQTEPTEGYPDGHLFLGTQAENLADMTAKGRRRSHEGKTHCPQKHPYSGPNLVRATGWWSRVSGLPDGCECSQQREVDSLTTLATCYTGSGG